VSACVFVCLSVIISPSLHSRSSANSYAADARDYFAQSGPTGPQVTRQVLKLRALCGSISVDKSVACTCRHVPACLHVGLRSDMNNSHRSNSRAQHLSMNGRKLMQHIGPFKAEGARGHTPPHLNLAPNVPIVISGK